MKHERSEISDKEAKFFLALKKATGWTTAKELSVEAGCSERTGRMYALKFVRLGLADLAEVFPAHRYKFAEKAQRRNAAYVQRMEQVVEVFGLSGTR